MLPSSMIQIGNKSVEYVTEDFLKESGIDNPYDFFCQEGYQCGAILHIPDKGYYVKSEEGTTEALSREEAESRSWDLSK